jgi:hypothetical protein
MRFLRCLLLVIALGAASLWFVGFARGFRGFTCVRVSHTCTSQDLRLQGHVVLWLAPLVCIVSLLLLGVSWHSRFRFQTSSKRAVAQRPPLAQQGVQLERPTRNFVESPSVDGPQNPEPESHPVDFSPRHAAKDQFITVYDRPANTRPRHAAPEPEPHWENSDDATGDVKDFS